LYDGGPAGVLYEFIVVSIFYIFIGAALAELASAIPSSAAGNQTRHLDIDCCLSGRQCITGLQ
jgi:amino acid permease